MNGRLSIVKPNPEHALQMTGALRSSDRRELQALGNGEPLADLLSLQFQHSIETHIVLEHTPWGYHWPIAAFGFAMSSLSGDTAHLWCLTCYEVGSYRKDILRTSKAYVALLRQRFRVLEAIVEYNYDASVRWLLWLGFKEVGRQVLNGIVFRVMRIEGQ